MTIPASQLVNVVPSVLSAGGAQLALNGVMLSSSNRIPVGGVLSFASAAAVGTYFGVASTEYAQAAIYFAGFTGCTQYPSALWITQYVTNLVGAYPYLRGGNISGVALAALQGYSGVLVVTVNGVARTSSSLNLTSATSFSNAATLIQASFTGANGYDGVVTASIAQSTANFTGAIVGNVMTVTAVASGTIQVGSVLSGTGGGGIPSGCTVSQQTAGAAGGTGTYVVSTTTSVSSASGIAATYGLMTVSAVSSGSAALGQSVTGTGVLGSSIGISALGSGTGGTGTYILSGGSATGTMSSSTVNLGALVVSYDSTAGAFVFTGGTPGGSASITVGSGVVATNLLLTTTTGAVLSQGAAVSAPGTFMAAVLTQTTNWATFWTAFNPDAYGNANKLAFASWTNSQVNRYLYAAWDTDTTATLSTAATTSLGYLCGTNGFNYSGTVPIYDPNLTGLAAFLCGMVAATNFSARNGRITEAYKNVTGLAAVVTTQTAYTNLIANGYNSLGSFALANQTLILWQNGSISGPFQWCDSYANQIWLNNALQSALLNFLAGINSVPYNVAGYSMLEAVISGVAVQGIYNGVINAGVPLTAAQIVQVNTAAGAQIDGILSSRGWYVQIQPASGAVRAARTSPPMTFWYMDGGSVQAINLASIEAQ